MRRLYFTAPIKRSWKELQSSSSAGKTSSPAEDLSESEDVAYMCTIISDKGKLDVLSEQCRIVKITSFAAMTFDDFSSIVY